MNIIDEWNSLTTERQFEWLQADVLIAAREQIGNNAAWFLEYHGIAHLTATAWNIAFEERMNERYISGRNANRETQISLNSIVYCEGKLIVFIRHARRPERSWFTLNIDTTKRVWSEVQLHGYRFNLLAQCFRIPGRQHPRGLPSVFSVRVIFFLLFGIVCFTIHLRYLLYF